MQPRDDTDQDPDEAMLAACAAALVAAVDAAVEPWVIRVVAVRLAAAGVDPAVEPWRSRSLEVAAATRAEVVERLRGLVESDVDAQRTTPLTILRDAVGRAAEVLAEAGVPPVHRDAWEEQSLPADRYALAPAALSDVDDSLHEPGLVWGAAKAHVVLLRRRREGRH